MQLTAKHLLAELRRVQQPVQVDAGVHPERLEQALGSGSRSPLIAETLAIPIGTVKSRTSYALRSLRLILDEMDIEP